MGSCEPNNTAERYRWALTFEVRGDIRFISHHDTVRMFERAFARAILPIRFTAGFNPHPRMSIPLPRPVGIASEAEALVIEFDSPVSCTEIISKLDNTMPSGIRITNARRLETREKLEPQVVRYRLDLADPPDQEMRERVQEILDSTTISVDRRARPKVPARVLDVRQYIEDMKIVDQTLEFTLRVTQLGTAKPSEIAGLLGFDPQCVNHRICRLNVKWRPNTPKIDPINDRSENQKENHSTQENRQEEGSEIGSRSADRTVAGCPG